MHDADSHIMEEPDWLHPYLDRVTRDRFPYVWSVGDEPGRWGIDKERARHSDSEYRAEDESQLMLRKNFSATGSFLNVDRPQALDLLGFSSQLVFDTFTSSPILRFDRDGDYALAVTLARAQHRAILEWCSVDARLLPVTVIPVGDMEAAVALTARRSTAGRPRSRSGSTAHLTTHRATSPSIRCGRCAKTQACRSCCTSPARAST